MDSLINNNLQIDTGRIRISTWVRLYKQYATCKINESRFIFFNRDNCFDNEVKIDLINCNIVILCPISSKKTISIIAKNILVFDTVKAIGNAVLNANQKLIFFGATISSAKNTLIGKRGVCFTAPTQKESRLSIEKFKTGIEKGSGGMIGDAFLLSYEIVQRQGKLQEREHYTVNNSTEEMIDVKECFEFFDIPILNTKN